MIDEAGLRVQIDIRIFHNIPRLRCTDLVPNTTRPKPLSGDQEVKARNLLFTGLTPISWVHLPFQDRNMALDTFLSKPCVICLARAANRVQDITSFLWLVCNPRKEFRSHTSVHVDTSPHAHQQNVHLVISTFLLFSTYPRFSIFFSHFRRATLFSDLYSQH